MLQDILQVRGGRRGSERGEKGGRRGGRIKMMIALLQDILQVCVCGRVKGGERRWYERAGGGGGRSAVAASSCTAQRVAEALVAVGVAAEVAVRGGSSGRSAAIVAPASGRPAARPAIKAAPVSSTRGAVVSGSAALPRYPAAWSRGGPAVTYPAPSRKAAEAPPSTDPAPATATAPPGQAAAPAGQRPIAPPMGLGLRQGVQPGIWRRQALLRRRLMATQNGLRKQPAKAPNSEGS